MTFDILATSLGVHDILWAPISGEKRLVRVWSQDEADLDGDRNQPSRFFRPLPFLGRPRAHSEGKGTDGWNSKVIQDGGDPKSRIRLI